MRTSDVGNEQLKYTRLTLRWILDGDDSMNSRRRSSLKSLRVAAPHPK